MTLDVHDWRGIYPACLTPLTPDERLDIPTFESFVASLLTQNVRGVYVAGSTGEEYAIDDSVRSESFKVAGRVAAGKARVIAHVGGVPTRRAISMARSAADAGCDAIAAIPPHGGKYTYEELTTYYQALAAATPAPLLVYHIPEVSGYDFSREQLSRWLEIPNVAGLKYTSFDLFKEERLATLHPDKLIFHGADQMLAQGLISGATGGIGSTYNLTAPLATKIFSAVARGDIPAAMRGQAALNAFIESMFAQRRLRGFKALAAKRLGWPSNSSPLPGLPVLAHELAAQERALEQALSTVL